MACNGGNQSSKSFCGYQFFQIHIEMMAWQVLIALVFVVQRSLVIAWQVLIALVFVVQRSLVVAYT